MQNAETVLGVLRERGRKGLPLDELYRQLFNPQLYLLAYGRIYSNDGAMTPGVTQETVDGMSWGKIGRIIDAVRHERYRFSPARRVWIPKKNGKLRPLGMPTWPDKLLGEVVRLLLEAYYEPQFSARSHGFRPGRGCHTALGEVARTWTGTTWFVEGDVADCFGSLDHEIMIKILAQKIRDNRFLRLMRNMLRAGYLEDWRWNATLSGAPQGGVVSPVLSNIYLHKLDDFAGDTLIPEFTRGETRTRNKEYERVRHAYRRARKSGNHEKARELRRRQAFLPSVDCTDPGYRRLHYARYADLCRRRHKSAYAELRVMPTLVPDSLVSAVIGSAGVGIILRGWRVVCLSGVVSVPPDGEMIMETDAGPGCVQPDVALLAEFRGWLDRERGLSPVSVRCYSKQSKAFLAGIGGAGVVSGLDAGKVTAFMVDWTQDRNTWSAKAMVTSLRAFLRFAHATGRTAAPLAGAVPAVASWQMSSLPQGLKAAEIERLLAACDRETAVGLRDHAVLSLLARLGLRGAEAAGLQLGDIGWRAGEIAVTGKGSRTERLPLPAPAGEALAAWLEHGRPECESRSVFVTVRRPYRPLTPESVRAVMGRACERAGLERRGTHRFRHALATEMLRAGASLPEVGQVLRHRSMLSTSIYAKVDQNALRPLARQWPGAGQ